MGARERAATKAKFAMRINSSEQFLERILENKVGN
jgi:hypothetical protein